MRVLRSSTRVERFVEMPMILKACDMNSGNPDCWKDLWVGQLLRPHMVIRWTDPVSFVGFALIIGFIIIIYQ